MFSQEGKFSEGLCDERSRILPGNRSNGIMSHRRAISLLPYESALNQRTAQTVGLFSVQGSIEFREPYSGVVLINESVFSRSPPCRPFFANLRDRTLRLTAFLARAVWSLFCIVVASASSHPRSSRHSHNGPVCAGNVGQGQEATHAHPHGIGEQRGRGRHSIVLEVPQMRAPKRVAAATFRPQVRPLNTDSADQVVAQGRSATISASSAVPGEMGA